MTELDFLVGVDTTAGEVVLEAPHVATTQVLILEGELQ